MKELTDDRVYKYLEEKYDELLLDYILLEANGAYAGEETHREAVIEADRKSVV